MRVQIRIELIFQIRVRTSFFSYINENQFKDCYNEIHKFRLLSMLYILINKYIYTALGLITYHTVLE
jgi:hypothetical protein